MSVFSLFPRVASAIARGALSWFANLWRRGVQGLKLFNKLRSHFSPLTSQEAGQLYQAGSEFTQAGTTTGGGPPAGVANPGVIPYYPGVGNPEWPAGSVYYDTRISYFDALAGAVNWINASFIEPDYFTSEALWNAALDQLLSVIGHYEFVLKGGGPDNFPLTGVTVYGIGRF